MRTEWERKALAALFGIVMALVILDGFDKFTPKPVHAASQFANIVCDNFTPVSIAADTQIITAGGANNFVYICSYNLNAVAADVFSIVEGTGSVCGTNTKAMVGGTTAAVGVSLATAGSVNYGGGTGAVTKTTVAGNNVCILRTTAGPLSGVVGSTQMPF